MADHPTPADRAAPRVAGYRHGRVPRPVREQQLLDHAERLFVEHGYNGVSIEDICRAAAVTRPLVYEYFGTKDGIYLACLRRIRDEFDATLTRAATHAPTLPDAIRQGAEAYFGVLENTPRRWSLVYGGTSGLVGEPADELYTLRARTVDHIAAIAARFAPTATETALTAYAHAVSGAGEQLGRWWLHRQDLPLSTVVETFLDIALGAFRQTLGRPRTPRRP